MHMLMQNCLEHCCCSALASNVTVMVLLSTAANFIYIWMELSMVQALRGVCKREVGALRTFVSLLCLLFPFSLWLLLPVGFFQRNSEEGWETPNLLSLVVASALCIISYDQAFRCLLACLLLPAFLLAGCWWRISCFVCLVYAASHPLVRECHVSRYLR